MTRPKSISCLCGALVALASWLTTAPAAAATNLVRNSGFEEDFNKWIRPRSRAAVDERQLGLAIDRRVVHGGRASARLTLDFD